MIANVDLEELKQREFFVTATQDDRYVWAEIKPSADHPAAEYSGDGWTWADGTSRYRLVRCAHREIDRVGRKCGHCGADNPYEPPAQESARKRRRK